MVREARFSLSPADVWPDDAEQSAWVEGETESVQDRRRDLDDRLRGIADADWIDEQES